MSGSASDFVSNRWATTVAAQLPQHPRVTVPVEPDLESTLADLRDSGLTVGLESGPNGFTVWLGDDPGAEELCASPREAAIWLTRVAVERHPQSNFAKRRA